MSLVGFKAQNHPQQVLVHSARSHVDDRGTTPEVFDPLHARFDFTIDVAAAPHNAKCTRFYSIDDDGLAQSWAGERVWCNPPYSAIEPWIAKAHSETAAELVVMLLPANRTEQGWWQRQVEPYRDRAGSLASIEDDQAAAERRALIRPDVLLARLQEAQASGQELDRRKGAAAS